MANEEHLDQLFMADLEEAVLSDADLSRATLTEASLGGAMCYSAVPLSCTNATPLPAALDRWTANLHKKYPH